MLCVYRFWLIWWWRPSTQSWETWLVLVWRGRCSRGRGIGCWWVPIRLHRTHSMKKPDRLKKTIVLFFQPTLSFRSRMQCTGRCCLRPPASMKLWSKPARPRESHWTPDCEPTWTRSSRLKNMSAARFEVTKDLHATVFSSWPLENESFLF